MRDLNFELRNLCLNSKEDSFATRSDRLSILDLVANQLHDLGFRRLSINGLKPKHVFALVDLWKHHAISIGTIKNRLACIRWWARKIGKFDMLPTDNSSFGIAERQYVSNVSKSSTLSFEDLDRVTDPHLRASLQLQFVFGLRREEALKFVPSWADRDSHILLKGSWCKGGQQRSIPILNVLQRKVLDNARLVAGFGSLIPNHRSYIQQLKAYEHLTQKVGLFKLHGLRHKYAQSRYFQLTGWLSPADGGPTKLDVLRSDSDIDSLSDQRKQHWGAADLNARLIISQELGHHRESITALYLGR